MFWTVTSDPLLLFGLLGFIVRFRADCGPSGQLDRTFTKAVVECLDAYAVSFIDRRHVAGDEPKAFLNARENAASDS